MTIMHGDAATESERHAVGLQKAQQYMIFIHCQCELLFWKKNDSCNGAENYHVDC